MVAKKKGFNPDKRLEKVKPPVIEGEQFRPWEWAAFEAYANPNHPAKTAQDLLSHLQSQGHKIGLSSINNLRQSKKWKAMVDFTAEYHQEKFYVGLFQEILDPLKTAMVDIVNGDWPEDDKNANAVVGIFREVARMGKRQVLPLSQLRAELDVNIQKSETVNVNMIHQILPLMTNEETNIFGRTGEVPQHLIQKKLIEIKADEEENL